MLLPRFGEIKGIRLYDSWRTTPEKRVVYYGGMNNPQADPVIPVPTPISRSPVKQAKTPEDPVTGDKQASTPDPTIPPPQRISRQGEVTIGEAEQQQGQ